MRDYIESMRVTNWTERVVREGIRGTVIFGGVGLRRVGMFSAVRLARFETTQVVEMCLWPVRLVEP